MKLNQGLHQSEKDKLEIDSQFAYYASLEPQDFKSYDLFREAFLVRVCKYCKMEESACICSQYDAEGNEL